MYSIHVLQALLKCNNNYIYNVSMYKPESERV